MLEQVVGWRDRCQAAVQDVRTYIEQGPAALRPDLLRHPTGSSGNDRAWAALPTPPSDIRDPSSDGSSASPPSPVLPLTTENGQMPRGSEKEASPDGQVNRGRAVGVGGGDAGGESGKSASPVLDTLPVFAGVQLPSVGRDLGVEAGLLERLGRLVCEGALIEVVDVHKEVCIG